MREHSIWNSVNPVLSPCSGEKLGLCHSFTGRQADWPLSSGAFPWRLAVCGWSDRDLTLAGTSEAILGRCSEHPVGGVGGVPRPPLGSVPEPRGESRSGQAVPTAVVPELPSLPPWTAAVPGQAGRQVADSPPFIRLRFARLCNYTSFSLSSRFSALNLSDFNIYTRA